MNALHKKIALVFLVIITCGTFRPTILAEHLKYTNQVVNPVSGQVLAERSGWIYISDKKTGQWKKLIPGKCPQWFTKGTGFIYFLDVGYDGDRAELWSANADGENHIRLSKSDYFIAESPVISKDDKKLAHHYSACRAAGRFEDIVVIELRNLDQTADAKVFFRAPEYTDIKSIKWTDKNQLQAVIDGKIININILAERKNAFLHNSHEKP